MAKPSEEIAANLKTFIQARPELKEALEKSATEEEWAILGSAAIIQVILDWLDEKFPEGLTKEKDGQ